MTTCPTCGQPVSKPVGAMCPVCGWRDTDPPAACCRASCGLHEAIAARRQEIKRRLAKGLAA